jgi:carboxylesterase
LSPAEGVRARPARDLAHARELFAALASRDGAEISQAGLSRFLPQETIAPLAVVLLHGFTNCPQQWLPFARTLHAAGHAVVIPRYPGHGYADLRTNAIALARTSDLLATASDAIDIAAGAGQRVAVAGLSIGGAFALRLAQWRDDVHAAVAIVPMLGFQHLDATENAFAAGVLQILPNLFVPWDPTGRNTTIPPYAYARFPTHLLAGCISSGIAAYDASAAGAPAGRVRFLLNAREPAVNNGLVREVEARLVRDRAGSADVIVLDDLPANHDIIDPTNPYARTDLVYPVVQRLLESA